MTAITPVWLEERGGLHDARILSASADADTVRITVDDEWANEREQPGLSGRGTLVLRGSALVLQGDVLSVAGGWISEVRYHGCHLAFDFCDREPLVVQASEASWEPVP